VMCACLWVFGFVWYAWAPLLPVWTVVGKGGRSCEGKEAPAEEICRAPTLFGLRFHCSSK